VSRSFWIRHVILFRPAWATRRRTTTLARCPTRAHRPGRSTPIHLDFFHESGCRCARRRRCDAAAAVLPPERGAVRSGRVEYRQVLAIWEGQKRDLDRHAAPHGLRLCRDVDEKAHQPRPFRQLHDGGDEGYGGTQAGHRRLVLDAEGVDAIRSSVSRSVGTATAGRRRTPGMPGSTAARARAGSRPARRASRRGSAKPAVSWMSVMVTPFPGSPSRRWRGSHPSRSPVPVRRRALGVARTRRAVAAQPRPSGTSRTSPDGCRRGRRRSC
jgi:hypothetical protein